MTEDEAKTKTCCGPITVLAGLLITTNPTRKDQPKPRCIGSACMAWRWGQKPNPSYDPTRGQMWPQPHPPVPMYIRDETTGGCGLAGSVQ